MTLTLSLSHSITCKCTDICSFDRWLIVAKDIFKWNDSCTRLFWEMLNIAVYYVRCDTKVFYEGGEVDGIELEYLVIFLILHIIEAPQTQRPLSPSAQYDAVWPTNNMFDDSTMSPTRISKFSHSEHMKSSSEDKISSMQSSSTTPALGNSNVYTLPHIKIPLVNSSNASPKSPRSPSSGSRPTSPSRMSHLNSPLHSRSCSYYLQLVKHKLPFILHALASVTGLISQISSPSDYHTKGSGSDFLLSKRTLDCLGFVLCGGNTKLTTSSDISMLYPCLSWGPDLSVTSSIDMIDMIDHPSPPYSDVIKWLERSLCNNENFYPSIPSSNVRFSSTNDLSDTFNNENNNDNMSFGNKSASPVSSGTNNNTAPARVLIPPAHLSRSKPTQVFNHNSTTRMHIATGQLTPASCSQTKAKKLTLTGISLDSQPNLREAFPYTLNDHDNDDYIDSFARSSLDSTDGDTNMSIDKVSSSQSFLNASPKQLSIPAASANSTGPEQLPQLIISSCTNSILYMLSPYLCGVIVGSSDSTIIIGAVSGALLVSGCERLKISCACRKLIVHNCLECEFNLASLSPCIISGDSRSLLFGPFNTTYKNLRNHLEVTNLNALFDSQMLEKTSSMTNCWSRLCDVNLCAEAVTSLGSPTGYAIDAADSLALLPEPHSSTASLLSTDKFSFIPIPYQAVNMTANFNVIPLPLSYSRVFNENLLVISKLYEKVKALQLQSSTDVSIESDDKTVITIPVSTLISKKFTDWLITNGSVQQVLDLIKMDTAQQD